ncbi:MAG: flagellar hook-associated protein FlgK [Desulfobacterales bacterium]|nr:flagellar hook-associated protein FlgK [Desulfobacterales bacterium]
MSGISSIFNIGREALITHQQAVDVTGHNIANANTPGFSRQRINLQTNVPAQTGSGLSGTGVTFTEIQRISDRFVGGRINSESQERGRWQAQQEALAQVEAVFDESAGFGLNSAMSQFWNSWQDLVNNPGGQTEREILAANTETLASTFGKLDTNLRKNQTDLDKMIAGTVGEVNQIAARIADLNDKINQSDASGLNPNDYRDSRDMLLQDLSGLVDFSSYEGDDGKVTVMLGDGRSLVGSGADGQLTTVTNVTTGFQDIAWTTDKGTAINSDITGGKIGGWIEVRDTGIPGYIDDLDELAAGIISAVNDQHQLGYDINNQPGIAYFTGSAAGDIALNPAIAADTNLIAASGTAGGAPGDNANAVTIAGLQQDRIMNGGMATFDDFYASLVSSVGIDVKSAAQTAQFEENLVTQLENYRESVAGVSLDEEMINLVKFQTAYDAAAKLIKTADEMISTVLNML